ncbi:MAG: hypothetical protein CME19_18445 [Gemmatimonadetes bacterium]|nr:hypothetical protein [Gemmatimonadota bacterium]
MTKVAWIAVVLSMSITPCDGKSSGNAYLNVPLVGDLVEVTVTDSSGRAVETVEQARLVNVRLRWRFAEPGDHDMDVAFRLGGKYVGRARSQYTRCRIGEWRDQTATFRVPHTLEAGSADFTVIVVDNGKAWLESEPIATMSVQAWHYEVSPGQTDRRVLGDNLLRNGSFEDGMSHWDMIFNSHGPGRKISIDSRVRYDGANSLRVDFSGGIDFGYICPYQIVRDLPEATYELSYFVRTENVTSQVGAQLELRFAGVTTSTDMAKGTSDWERRSIEFEARGGLEVYFRRYGGDGQSIGGVPLSLSDYGPIGGTVWIDRIHLRRL